jgi:flavin reductase (DIM6/NTAB) family NADH-FMN oxidoreductase RutF
MMIELAPKEAFAKFRPERVIFILSVDEQGKPSGMAAGRFMTCSSEPPLLAIVLGQQSYTRKLIHGSKEFVVAVPNKKLEKELLFFGSNHGDEVDKFKASDLKITQSQSLRTPLLLDATINFECRLENETELEKGTLFIGRVVHAYLNQDGNILMNMGKKGEQRIFKEFEVI